MHPQRKDERKAEAKTAPTFAAGCGAARPAPSMSIDEVIRERRSVRRWRKKSRDDAKCAAGSFAAANPPMKAKDMQDRRVNPPRTGTSSTSGGSTNAG